MRGELACPGLAGFLLALPGLHVPAGIAFFGLLFVVLYDILMLLLHVRQTDLNVLSAAIAAYLLLGVAGRHRST